MNKETSQKIEEGHIKIAKTIDIAAKLAGFAIGSPISVPIAAVGIGAIFGAQTLSYAQTFPSWTYEQLKIVWKYMPAGKEQSSSPPIFGGYEIEGTKNVSLEKAKKIKGSLTNLELDSIVMDNTLRKQYYAFLPAWTSTHLTLKGSKAVVKQGGKTYRFDDVPINNGWYEQDKYGLGLPFGKPSSSSNPKARYLWRVQEYTGLVARGYYWLVYDWRFVDCFSRLSRLGVLARKGKVK